MNKFRAFMGLVACAILAPFVFVVPAGATTNNMHGIGPNTWVNIVQGSCWVQVEYGTFGPTPYANLSIIAGSCGSNTSVAAISSTQTPSAGTVFQFNPAQGCSFAKVGQAGCHIIPNGGPNGVPALQGYQTGPEALQGSPPAVAFGVIGVACQANNHACVAMSFTAY